MQKIRLDKYIADTTELTRKDAKNAIRKGRVTVDGVIIKKDSEKIKECAYVQLDGKDLKRQQFVYIMLNKPAGVVSATKDNLDTTVISLIEEIPGHEELFPVGRLDKDTEGLLLITDDGDLAHRLLSPKKHVDKVYYLEYEGSLAEDSEQQVEKGLDIGEEKLTKPGVLKFIEEGKLYLTISEGKFHQVKRMIKVLGGTVTYLKRMSMGSLQLDEQLQPGQYRFLTEQEIEELGGIHG